MENRSLKIELDEIKMRAFSSSEENLLDIEMMLESMSKRFIEEVHTLAKIVEQSHQSEM